jgi:glycosyltransferase involved in cell wall biosynthesis
MIEVHRIDFLYCGDNFSKLIGGVAARLTRRRIIGTCHDMLDRGLLGGMLKTLNLLALDRVIAVSDVVRGSFPMQGPMSGKVVTIPNGVDIQRFDPAHSVSTIRAELNLDPAAIVIGSIGMLDNNKGHACLLRAFHDLTQRCAETVHLIMVGDGPEKARLKQLAHELGLEMSVHFVGYRRDMPAILKGTDIVVVPSIEYESFSLAAVEAMAMQVPVVASRLGGLAEVVEEGKTGLFFSPGDHAQLFVALRALIADSTLRAKMGQAGRQRVRERYLATVQDQRIQEEFLSLCAGQS